MTMFAQHIFAAKQQRAVQDTMIQSTDEDKDPMANVPEDSELNQQSEQHVAESEVTLTQVEQAAPEQAADATDTDVKLPEGEFGDAPEKTGPADDVVVNADDSEVMEDDEAGMESMFASIDANEQEIELLDTEMRMLTDSALAIEQFGFNPTTAAIMQTTGLLNGTALESLGLESITVSAGDSAESQLALESVLGKIAEKTTQWAAKILHVAKMSGEGVISVLTPLWKKISGMVSAIGEKAWDKTKAAGAVVAAHPYATIASVIASAAAVAGLVAFVASGAPAPGAKLDVFKSFVNTVRDHLGRIKFPGGKLVAKISESGTKIMVVFEKSKDVVKGAALSSLGWSQTAVKAMSGQLNRAWDALQQSWTALGTRSMKLVRGAGDLTKEVFVGAEFVGVAGGVAGKELASKVVGTSKAGRAVSTVAGYAASRIVTSAYFGAIISLIGLMFRITKYVVVGGFRMIASTLKAIMPHAQPA